MTNFLSESLRIETRGKIKVTIIKPTGVPATNPAGTVVNQAAVVGILGQNMAEFMEMFAPEYRSPPVASGEHAVRNAA